MPGEKPVQKGNFSTRMLLVILLKGVLRIDALPLNCRRFLPGLELSGDNLCLLGRHFESWEPRVRRAKCLDVAPEVQEQPINEGCKADLKY